MFPELIGPIVRLDINDAGDTSHHTRRAGCSLISHRKKRRCTGTCREEYKKFTAEAGST